MLSTGKLLILLHEEELVKKIGAQNTSHPLDTECFSKIVRTDKDDFFMNVLDGFCGLKLKNRARRLDRRGAYSKNPGARHPQTLRLEGGAYKVVQTKAGGRSAEEALPGKTVHTTTASSWSFIDHTKKNPASHFGWGRRVLSGMRIAANTKALEEKHVIVKMLMQYDGGTFRRPYDGEDIKTVEKYLKFKRPILKTSVSELVTMPRQHNEALIYVKWLTDGTSQLTICDESLNSKVTTLFRKIIMDRCLKQREGGAEVNIPVSFLIEGKAPAYFNGENLTSLLAGIKKEMEGQGVNVSDNKEILRRIVENTYNETFKTQCYPHYDVLASMLVGEDDFYFNLIAEKERSGTDKFKLLHYLLHSNNISALEAYMKNIFSKIEEDLAIVQFITEFPFDKISHPGQYNPEQYFDVKHERQKEICKEKTSIITTYLNGWLRKGKVSEEKHIETLKRLVLATVSQDDSALQHVDHEKMSPKDYRVVVLAAVSKNGLALQYVGHKKMSSKDYRAVVLAAVAQNGAALKHASAELKKDREVVLAAVAQNGAALEYASPALQADPAVVLAAVTPDGWALKHAPAFKNNPAVVLAAVAQNGHALRYASAGLQADRDVVQAAVAQNGMALQHVGHKKMLPKDYRAVVLAAVAQNGMALQHVGHKKMLPKDYRAVVLAAVAQNGMALQYASPELRANRDVVQAAVAQNGMALQYASPELRANRDVVQAAVAQDGRALQYVGHEEMSPQEYSAVALAAVTEYGMALQYASESLLGDRAMVQAAVRKNGMALQYASPSLQGDYGVVLAAVRKNGMALQYASEALRANRLVVQAAVRKNGMALEFASTKLRADRRVVQAAVAQNGYALEFASETLRDDGVVVQAAFDLFAPSYYDSLKFAGKTAVLAVVGKYGMALEFASEAVQKELISQDPSRLEYASPSLQGDYGVVLAAVAQNGRALQYATPAVQKGLISEDPSRLQYVTPVVQEELIGEDPSRLQYVSNEVKIEFIRKSCWSGTWVTIKKIIATIDREELKELLLTKNGANNHALDWLFWRGGEESVKILKALLKKDMIPEDLGNLLYHLSKVGKDEGPYESVSYDSHKIEVCAKKLNILLEHLSPKQINSLFRMHEDRVRRYSGEEADCLRSNIFKIILKSLQTSEKLQNSSDFVLAIVAKDAGALKYASREVQKKLIWQKVSYLQYASNEVKIEIIRDLCWSGTLSDIRKITDIVDKKDFKKFLLSVDRENNHALDRLFWKGEKESVKILEHLSEEEIIGKQVDIDVGKLLFHLSKVGKEKAPYTESASDDDIEVCSKKLNILLKHLSPEKINSCLAYWLDQNSPGGTDPLVNNGFKIILKSLQTSEKLQNSSDFVLAIVAKDAGALKYATPAVQKRLISQDPGKLQYASTGVKNDSFVVWDAVTNNGMALQHALDRLRRNYDFILAAVRQNGMALQHAHCTGMAFQDYSAVALAAVRKDGRALQYVDYEKIRLGYSTGENYYLVALAAVRQNGMALQYVDPEKLRPEDYDAVALAAVRQNDGALQHVPKERLDDDAFILAAVEQNSHALQHVPEERLGDDAFILAAVAQNGMALQYVDPEKLRPEDYSAVALAAVRKDGRALQYVDPEKLRPEDYSAVALAAVRQNGGALQYASEPLRADPEVVLAAVAQNSKAFQYASEILKNDPKIKDVAKIQGHIEKLKEEKEKGGLFCQKKLKNQKIKALRKIRDHMTSQSSSLVLDETDYAALKQGLFRHESWDTIVGLTSEQGKGIAKTVKDRWNREEREYVERLVGADDFSSMSWRWEAAEAAKAAEPEPAEAGSQPASPVIDPAEQAAAEQAEAAARAAAEAEAEAEARAADSAGEVAGADAAAEPEPAAAEQAEAAARAAAEAEAEARAAATQAATQAATPARAAGARCGIFKALSGLCCGGRGRGNEVVSGTHRLN